MSYLSLRWFTIYHFLIKVLCSIPSAGETFLVIKPASSPAYVTQFIITHAVSKVHLLDEKLCYHSGHSKNIFPIRKKGGGRKNKHARFREFSTAALDRLPRALYNSFSFYIQALTGRVRRFLRLPERAAHAASGPANPAERHPRASARRAARRTRYRAKSIKQGCTTNGFSSLHRTEGRFFYRRRKE